MSYQATFEYGPAFKPEVQEIIYDIVGRELGFGTTDIQQIVSSLRCQMKIFTGQEWQIMGNPATCKITLQIGSGIQFKLIIPSKNMQFCGWVN